MPEMNDVIRAAVGGNASVSTDDKSGRTPANSAALKNIATNGALFNQGLGRLAQTLVTLKTSWGG